MADKGQPTPIAMATLRRRLVNCNGVMKDRLGLMRVIDKDVTDGASA